MLKSRHKKIPAFSLRPFLILAYEGEWKAKVIHESRPFTWSVDGMRFHLLLTQVDICVNDKLWHACFGWLRVR